MTRARGQPTRTLLNRKMVRLSCAKCDRALPLRSIENLDQDQEPEGAGCDSRYIWDVLVRSGVISGMNSGSRLVPFGLVAVGAAFALALAFHYML
jgi:hypothetical protein